MFQHPHITSQVAKARQEQLREDARRYRAAGLPRRRFVVSLHGTELSRFWWRRSADRHARRVPGLMVTEIPRTATQE